MPQSLMKRGNWISEFTPIVKPESCCSYLVRLHSESSCTHQCHFRTLFRALRRLGDLLFAVRSYYSFPLRPDFVVPPCEEMEISAKHSTYFVVAAWERMHHSHAGVKVTYKSMCDFFKKHCTTLCYSFLTLKKRSWQYCPTTRNRSAPPSKGAFDGNRSPVTRPKASQG